MTDVPRRPATAFITSVWAIRSYLDRSRRLPLLPRVQPRRADATFWLARGPASRQVIEPLRKRWRGRASRSTSARVTSVSCKRWPRDRDRPQEGEDSWSEQVDELILAVPETPCCPWCAPATPGQRVVEAAPRLAEVSRLRRMRIPIVHLYFNRKLRISLPSLWACSAHGWRSPSPTSPRHGREWPPSPAAPSCRSRRRTRMGSRARVDDDAHAMLGELAEYIDFDPGERWGESRRSTGSEPTSSRTRTPLFVNETGSDIWRPGRPATASRTSPSPATSARTASG